MRSAGGSIVAEPLQALEPRRLDEGWSAIGVPPGSTDERLAGLDSQLLPARVPGTAAGALSEAGQLARWPERDLDAEDWWFRCRFPAVPDAADEETSLRLEGIATVADVWLNGEHLLASDDMHVAHELPVPGLLRADNELVIGIRALAPLLAARRPRPRWRTRLVRSQGLRGFRTSLFGRIPAFAPGPAPVGPWRPVSLVRRRSVALEDLVVRAAVDGSAGQVRVTASCRRLGDIATSDGVLRVTGPDGEVAGKLEIEGGKVDGIAVIPAARRWWPHTHGAPALYDVALSLVGEWGEATFDGGRVGFRELEATDEPGLALAVNGEPVFCRGGTLLPDAVAIERPGHELRRMLELARDAGMNMIRLSGVGVYGSEELYALCDELGILVWQDFPFANLDYPVEDEAFRTTVDREARGFLTSAGAHPSLVVVCGNSEVEQQVAMLGLDPELGRGPLFAEHLPGLIAELGVDAHYLPSTPTGGALPFRPDRGVAHYFGVGAYRRPLEDARRTEVRFASECLAFANVPDSAALEELGVADCHQPAWKAGVPRDSGAGWDFDDVRDHYLHELYGVDPVGLRSVDPERYLALSRVVTGEVMAATLGEWRRARSTCRGALLWTLNDALPGAGWGLLDSRARPKPAYWYVRRALAPIAVWTTDEGTNGIAVHATNETREPVRGELAVELFRRDGPLVDHGVAAVRLEPGETIETSVEEILDRFVDAGHAYRFGPPGSDAIVVELREKGKVRSRTVKYPGGLASAAMLSDDVGLDAIVTEARDFPLSVEVRASRLAYAVAVEAPGFASSDNHFTIPPGGSHTLTLTPLDAAAAPGTVLLRALNARGTTALRPR